MLVTHTFKFSEIIGWNETNYYFGIPFLGFKDQTYHFHFFYQFLFSYSVTTGATVLKFSSPSSCYRSYYFNYDNSIDTFKSFSGMYFFDNESTNKIINLSSSEIMFQFELYHAEGEYFPEEISKEYTDKYGITALSLL